MAKSTITENDLSSVNMQVGPKAKFSIGDDTIAEVELLSVLDSTPSITGLTARALEQFQGLTTDKLFASIRHTQPYDDEWQFLGKLRENPPTEEWKMACIALCAHFAIEASAAYPFLESDARKWLRNKFKELGVSEFEAAWRDYMHVKQDVMLGYRRLYERVGHTIHVAVSDASFPTLS